MKLVKLLITVFLLITIGISYFLIGRYGGYATMTGLRKLGIVRDEILISGTGSMYPTFPKGTGSSEVMRMQEIVAQTNMRVYPGGITIGPFSYGSYQLQHGDIISFSNSMTQEISTRKFDEKAGFVKRVIGLAGDTIEIRNGFVWRNGKIVKEQYTARAQSTYGGTYLPDCHAVRIANGHVFVLGDNRTASDDSRYELGLVKFSDIDHVLPWNQQDQFYSRWRDASHDEALIDKPTLNVGLYLEFLNQKRIAAGVEPLKFNSQLNQSAHLRGVKMLATDDLSFEATRSGYTMATALNDVGYSNILYGESSSLGYFTADELIENSFEFSDSKEFLLNNEYDDIGVAAVVGDLNDCPTQIVVQHFGGFIPPTYSAQEINGWQKLLENLREVIPGWESAKQSKEFYEEHKSDIDRLLDILHSRRELAQTVVDKMKKLQWLSDEERSRIDRDESQARQANEIIEKINK